MSLLTGDPRGATVIAQVDSLVLEVSKASFEPIIKARPEIAEVLSRTIEFRNQQNETENNRQLQGEVSGDRPLLARIRDFFSLNNGDGLRSSALN
jgi:CRP-like cAMP-binding protein